MKDIFCESCDNPEPATMTKAWYYWRCIASPKPSPTQRVVRDPWLLDNPFELCRAVINHETGECALFEPRKEVK